MSNISKLLLKDSLYAPIIENATIVGAQLEMNIFLVGGFVRDLLLNRTLIDIDLMVEGNASEFAKKLSEKLKIKKVIEFEKFHTYRIPCDDLEIDIAEARKESYESTSRKPSKVVSASINEDLERRDFTVNAIAVSINKKDFGKIIDPFKGLQDLDKGILKTPKDPDITFSDDPLRMLRAIRFAAQLNFVIEKNIIKSIKNQIDRIKIVSAERITSELIKLLKTDKPSIGFYLLKETKLLGHVFPELDIMSGIDVVDGKSHKDVFIHTLEVVDNAAKLTNKMSIRFAALVHDIAKPQTKKFYKNKGWTFHGHEEIGRRMLKDIAKRMKISNELRDYLMILTKLHLRPIALAKKNITDRAVRRVMFEAGDYIDDLMVLCRADITTKNSKKIKQYMANFEHVDVLMKDVKTRDEIKAFKCPVNGNVIMKELSLSEGRIVGKIKYEIETAILDGKIENDYKTAFEYMMKIKDNFITN